MLESKLRFENWAYDLKLSPSQPTKKQSTITLFIGQISCTHRINIDRFQSILTEISIAE